MVMGAAENEGREKGKSESSYYMSSFSLSQVFLARHWPFFPLVREGVFHIRSFCLTRRRRDVEKKMERGRDARAPDDIQALCVGNTFPDKRSAIREPISIRPPPLSLFSAGFLLSRE
jgi:hypothetical protein